MSTEKSPIWHPMTQHGLMGPAISIDRAQGSTLYASDGREIIDGISSWWVITHGHGRAEIVAAVQAQVAKLEQVIFAGFTHEPAEALTDALLEMTDPVLEYVFYSDSGSTAIEVALKMAIGMFEHQGRPRKTIVALEGGYHGDTFGAMSVGARGVFNRVYEPYLFDVKHLPFPGDEGTRGDCLTQFEALLKGGDVAALILEPIIQGAAGMRSYAPALLKALCDLCRAHGALLIADEVMTGFGRTGHVFACDQAGIAPDLLCLSKGLTGGFLPMGATLCTSQIYDAFYHTDRARQFFHSTSFTGNPIACAAALANLQIWQREDVLAGVQGIQAAHEGLTARLRRRDDVRDVRIQGSIAAFDVTHSTDGYLSDLGPKLYDLLLEQNVLLRPIGNTVYILPPYCITSNELERIYDVIEHTLDRLKDEGSQRAA